MHNNVYVTSTEHDINRMGFIFKPYIDHSMVCIPYRVHLSMEAVGCHLCSWCAVVWRFLIRKELALCPLPDKAAEQHTPKTWMNCHATTFDGIQPIILTQSFLFGVCCSAAGNQKTTEKSPACFRSIFWGACWLSTNYISGRDDIIVLTE